MDKNTIDIICREEGSEDREYGMEDRGEFGDKLGRLFTKSSVEVSVVEENLKAFVGTLREIIQGLPAALGQYDLDTIEISAEISATGKVSLLGIGGDVCGKGGLTFTLKRAGSDKDTAGQP